MKKIIFIIILILVAACKVQTGTNEGSSFQVIPTPTIPPGVTPMPFATVSPAFSGCFSCHPRSGWDPGSEASTLTWVVRGNPAGSILYQRATSDTTGYGMHNYINDAGRELIRQYILRLPVALLALQVQKATALEPTYASLKTNLFDKSCVQCHRGFNNKRSIITKYDDILFSMTDAWTMNRNEMPPMRSNVPWVSDDVIKTFIKWKEAGFAD